MTINTVSIFGFLFPRLLQTGSPEVMWQLLNRNFYRPDVPQLHGASDSALLTLCALQMLYNYLLLF